MGGREATLEAAGFRVEATPTEAAGPSACSAFTPLLHKRTDEEGFLVSCPGGHQCGLGPCKVEERDKACEVSHPCLWEAPALFWEQQNRFGKLCSS